MDDSHYCEALPQFSPPPRLLGEAIDWRTTTATGEDRPGAIRLSGIGNVYASPVGASGRVYVTDLEGATIVLSHEDTPRVLALNRLDDSFAASAALAGRELFLRGQKSLYCIADDSRP